MEGDNEQTGCRPKKNFELVKKKKSRIDLVAHNTSKAPSCLGVVFGLGCFIKLVGAVFAGPIMGAVLILLSSP